MSADTEVTGAVVNLTVPDDGGTQWVARQIEVPNDLPEVEDDDGRLPLEFKYGPNYFCGYVDPNTWEVGMAVTVAGVYIGTVTGNMKDGVDVEVDLSIAKGSFKIYLKNGCEIWIHQDIKITFNGSYYGDYKLRTV